MSNVQRLDVQTRPDIPPYLHEAIHDSRCRTKISVVEMIISVINYKIQRWYSCYLKRWMSSLLSFYSKTQKKLLGIDVGHVTHLTNSLPLTFIYLNLHK